MITAKEAKKLYDESGVEVENFLTYNVEKEVTSATKAGKRTVTINIGTITPYQDLDQIITPLNRAVSDKLRNLGFSVAIQKYGDSYVHRGLAADEDGNGPSHRNYGFVIGW